MSNGPKRCTIIIDEQDGVSIHWEPSLSDLPHKLNWVETAAGGAILGVGKAVTGQGSLQIVQALRAFEKGREKK